MIRKNSEGRQPDGVIDRIVFSDQRGEAANGVSWLIPGVVNAMSQATLVLGTLQSIRQGITMATGLHNHPSTENPPTTQQPQIECGNCAHVLPLRLSGEGELPAVWLCSHCQMPYSGICLKDQLSTISNNIQLDQRYFNTRGFQPISSWQRQKITNIVNRQSRVINLEKRRSARIDQSLLVSGITLNGDLNPLGVPIQLMVVNLSKEGVGLVTCCPIYAFYLALDLSPSDNKQIQVVVRVVRERLLDPPFREYGAEFIARLGMASPE